MFTRALMEFDEEGNGGPGEVPEFGAIFMSNTATMKECFRRKIFGLPSSQAHFVEHVKAGMVLFLFEFEKKRLYGVFQAQSDGAMNILSQAFSSSGKQFPAQVPFSTIWNCSPLSEHEFCSAIEENYFSANRFNFGLSKAQVHRLLQLFNSRRLEDQLPRRQLSINNVAKPYGDSLGKFTRRGDNISSSMGYRLENELGVDNDLGLAILTKNSGISLGKLTRITDNVRFLECERDKNFQNLAYGHESTFPSEYRKTYSDEATRAAGDGRFAVSNNIASEHNVDNNVSAVNSSECYGSYSCDMRRAADDIRFSLSDSHGSRHNGDPHCGSAPQMHHYENYLGAEREVFDGCRAAVRDGLRNQFYSDNDIGSLLSTSYLGDLMGNLKGGAGDDCNFVSNGSVREEHCVDYDSGPNILTNYPRNSEGTEMVVADDGSGHAVSYQIGDDERKFRHSPSLRVNHGSTSQKCASPYSYHDRNFFTPSEVQSGTLQHDRCKFAVRHSPSLRVDHGSTSQKCASPYSCPEGNFFTPSNAQSGTLQKFVSPLYKSQDTFFPSFKKHSLPFHQEPNNFDKCLDASHLPGNNTLLPTHSPYEYLHFNRDIPLLGAQNFENKPVGSTLEDYKGVSFSESSVPPVHITGAGNYVKANIGHTSYSSDLNRNNLSFVADHGCPIMHEDKFEHKIPWDTSEAFKTGAPVSTGISRHFVGGAGSLQNRSIRYKDHDSVGHDFKYYENNEGTAPDRQKSRSSVFFRLTAPPKSCPQENNSHVGADELNLDTSVDKIMEMLDSSHQHWAKMSKSKRLIRQNVSVENLRFKKHASIHPRTGRNCLEKPLLKIDADATPPKEEGGTEMAEETPFVNFKRRSELQKVQEEDKIQNEIKAKGHTKNADTEGLSPGQRKRRKLCRPNFT